MGRDETFEVLTLMQTGKARVIPVVLLARPDGIYWETWMKFLTQHLLKFGFISQEDLSFFKIAHNVREAVREILQFYKIYHSARWVGKKLVIRISHRLSKKAIVDLNERFSTCCGPARLSKTLHCAKKKTSPRFGICRG